jgi:hypothetical protein
VGAELAIHGDDLRNHRLVAVRHDCRSWGTTAVSDLPAAHGLAGTADELPRVIRNVVNGYFNCIDSNNVFQSLRCVLKLHKTDGGRIVHRH